MAKQEARIRSVQIENKKKKEKGDSDSTRAGIDKNVKLLGVLH